MLRRTGLRDWLSDQRQVVQIRNELMALQYDAEGACDAGQLGMGNATADKMILFGAVLHESEAGQRIDGPCFIDNVAAALEALQNRDPDKGRRALELLTDSATDISQLRGRLRRVGDLLEALGVSDASSRGASIKGWADQTRRLRSVTAALGLPGDDGWYIAADGAAGWYREVSEAAQAADKLLAEMDSEPD
jgi:hypothetical protein